MFVKKRSRYFITGKNRRKQKASHTKNDDAMWSGSEEKDPLQSFRTLETEMDSRDGPHSRGRWNHAMST